MIYPSRKDHVDLFDTWFNQLPIEGQHLLNDYIADRVQKSFKVGKQQAYDDIEKIIDELPPVEFISLKTGRYDRVVTWQDALKTKLKENK